MRVGDGLIVSGELINLLSRLEWPNQETIVINIDNNRVQVPNVAWVGDRLLAVARQRFREVKEGVKPAGYYADRDVSWARPSMPMPYIADGPDDPRIAQVEACIQRVLDDYEVCTLEYLTPKVRLE